MSILYTLYMLNTRFLCIFDILNMFLHFVHIVNIVYIILIIFYFEIIHMIFNFNNV